MRPIGIGAGAGAGAVEFNFDSACTTPYISAPSSPQRFGSFFYSAPTSPTRISTFYTCSGIPTSNDSDSVDDFAFDFSGQLEVTTTADELFDGGIIKPLSTKPTPPPPPPPPPPPIQNQERGRERSSSRNKKLGGGGGGRSLSPFRVSDLLLNNSDEPKMDSDPDQDQDHPSSSSAGRFSTSSFVSFWYRRKWKLKDLLLFRSASDGHSMTKEQLNKYAILKHHQAHEDVKNSSFRSTDTKGGASVVSAHELHYRAKRAMAQDLKRKTSLPYKPDGFFGCLGR